MAIHEILGKNSLDWTEEEIAQARSSAQHETLVNIHKFTQWIGYGQLAEALATIHDAGGKVLFDIPMFRGKDSVDVWKHRKKYFQDVRTRNPGINRPGVDANWKDLALWNWKELDREGFTFILEPFRYWLTFSQETEGDTSFDGARVDAFHFAYNFGNGQIKSGDEPGNAYTGALITLFKQHGALALAEAFEGRDREARELGYITVKGDEGAWQPITTHDDPRKATGWADRDRSIL